MKNTFRSRIAAAAAALVLVGAFAVPAYAQSSNTQPELTLSQIESRLSGQGFRVVEIERDDGLYEVKAFNDQNRCVELHLDRRSGEIVRTESDDDCYGDDRRRGGRNR
ncbi:MAG: PepSY domain-containing protein [Hyphomonadaceae bacterium JAD_PAG50586_4]|nr:MAG: PepSY domain-containing protein [Hyphomonadaceae bacterium JAD_PAG50586_4]